MQKLHYFGIFLISICLCNVFTIEKERVNNENLPPANIASI